MSEIQVHCKFDKMVNPKELKDNNKNRNKHGNDQIERLADMYKYHGIRHPIIVSNLSGLIVAGHGRKLAAIRAGMKEFPVVYQDFKDSDSEYAFLQSDNAIALWSELDLGLINMDLVDLGPDLDIKMLGLKNFTLDMGEKDLPDLGDGSDPLFGQMTFIVKREYKSTIDEAIKKAKDSVDEEGNANGLALAKICEQWLKI